MPQCKIEIAFPTAIAISAFTPCIPTSKTVPATPRARHTQAHLSGGGIHMHVALQRTDFETIAGCPGLNEMCQEFITPGFMVSVEFTIGGYKTKLCLSCIAFALHKEFR